MTRRILMIGDSILEGMMPHLYRLLSSGAYGAGDARIDARSGWSTRRWMNEGEIRSIVSGFRPSHVVVALGTNDEGEEGNPTGYAEKVVRVRDQAGALGARVLWVTAFSGSGVERRFEITREALGAPSTINGRDLMHGVSMSGEIHPSGVGYRTLSLHLLGAVFDRIGSQGARSGISPAVPVAIGAILAGLGLWAWRSM